MSLLLLTEVRSTFVLNRSELEVIIEDLEGILALPSLRPILACCCGACCQLEDIENVKLLCLKSALATLARLFRLVGN